jgi:hypothetical protein
MLSLAGGLWFGRAAPTGVPDHLLEADTLLRIGPSIGWAGRYLRRRTAESQGAAHTCRRLRAST